MIFTNTVMADNYLERRMEEFRSGKLSLKKRIPGIKPDGKKVVVARGSSGKALEKVLGFRTKGCRVAVFDPDLDAGRKLAYQHGVRFHRVNINNNEDLQRETFSLISAWRRIDVIVGTDDECHRIKECLDRWCASLPIPIKLNPEIIVLK